MLGFIGRWAASKGMVIMPNLFGLPRTSAINAINQAGLNVGNQTTTTTSDPNNQENVSSQSITSGQLVDYETVVNFNYQLFSFTPYSFTPAYSFTPTPYSFTPTPYTFTPVTSMTYWATACCTTSTSSNQITATSSMSTGDAVNQLNALCSVSPSNVQTGSYTTGTTPNIPSLSCCADVDNGYQWVTCNGSSVYLPTTINTCTGVVSYTCPTEVWYCSVSYYGPNIPSDYYTTDFNETGQFCSMYNIVCSSDGYPPIPPKPPACQTYSFTPYSFTPAYSFTPTPYSFTPTPEYSFTPTPYTFTPYSFTPIAYSFTPLRYCIDQDTPVLVVGENDSIITKPAIDISVGDYVWTMTWDELVDEITDPYVEQSYENISNSRLIKTQIISASNSTKAFTIIINDDMDKRFSLEEKVFIKRNGLNMFDEAKNIIPGDFIYEIVDGVMTPVIVHNTTVIDQVRTVCMFNAYPTDTIIAGNMVVHNSKTF